VHEALAQDSDSIKGGSVVLQDCVQTKNSLITNCFIASLDEPMSAFGNPKTANFPILSAKHKSRQ